MTRSPIRLRHIGALGVTVAVMAMTVGVAGSEPLKEPHQGTVADCDGAVEWHFVHNRTDADHGLITVGTLQVASGEPFEASVLHYWVDTESNVLPTDVADDVTGGALVLSHYTCVTSSTTTTTDPPTTSVDPSTTASTTTTSTTTTTTTEAPVTSTTSAVVTVVLPAVEVAAEAGAVDAQPTFTG